MKFSLLFFSQIEGEPNGSPYRLILEAAQYTDAHGFEAVWIPERHFSSVGGIYPNPAVIASALAATTDQIRLRSGSVVLPLHHPVSVVEDWAAVDQLSGGRVDLAFASGWNPRDFLFSPQSFSNRRSDWLERIPVIQSIWRKGSTVVANSDGVEVKVDVYPRPVQPELSIWLTVTRLKESFEIAGSMGLNVLTMLSGITLQQLSENIKIYRNARNAAGIDPSSGIVTLMMHTYIHEDIGTVRQRVSGPLMRYLKDSAKTHLDGGAISMNISRSEREIERIAEYSFERYFATAALFGDVETTKFTVEKLAAAGVDEIASMIDFGLSVEHALEGLNYLQKLKNSRRN
ncbi:luciferase-like monooxygenase (plasmid) [Candidatus Burkholderia crenata]|nr:luciferase-like monooxygenase [Candidatus Burkholderia crenata]